VEHRSRREASAGGFYEEVRSCGGETSLVHSSFGVVNVHHRQLLPL